MTREFRKVRDTATVAVVAGCLLTLAFFGCTGGTTKETGCGDAGPCPAGHVCLDAACYQLCKIDEHCTQDQTICVKDICQVGERTDPPAILSVDGESAEDADPDHTNQHVHNRLLISGRHLAGTSATLTDGQDDVQELVVCHSEGHLLEVELPDSISPGQYVLSVATQAGSCGAVLPVLQGEPGPQGEKGEPGKDGVNGRDGANGKDGKDGAPGSGGLYGLTRGRGDMEGTDTSVSGSMNCLANDVLLAGGGRCEGNRP